jgi:metal-responsive CopG/Arc/MetJ family transcriptional regulator
MSTVKVAITLEEGLLKRVDSLVTGRVFSNRSKAIQAALTEKLDNMEAGRLARECAKLDKTIERAMADEGLGEGGVEWPEY